jgi:hypothetical protein
MHTRALGIPLSTMAAPIKALENAIVSSLIETISQVNRTQKSGYFEKEKSSHLLYNISQNFRRHISFSVERWIKHVIDVNRPPFVPLEGFGDYERVETNFDGGS